MTPKQLGYAAAIIAVILWAGNFVVARAVAHAIPPIQLNFWRWFIALLCVLPFGLHHIRQDFPIIRKHFWYMTWQALMGVVLLNTLFYQAGKTSTSINMVLFVPSAPIIILLLSRIICGEAITKRRFFGLLTILFGLTVLISRGSLENLTNFDFNIGDFWSIGGITCFGIYSFFARYRPKELGTASYHTTVFSIGLIICLPLLVAEMKLLPPATWNEAVIISVLYAGIGCSCIAYVLWSVAIERIGPVAAGMIYYSIPLFTAMKGVLILGEQITFVHIIGGSLMLLGIVAATLPGKPPYARSSK